MKNIIVFEQNLLISKNQKKIISRSTYRIKIKIKFGNAAYGLDSLGITSNKINCTLKCYLIKTNCVQVIQYGIDVSPLSIAEILNIKRCCLVEYQFMKQNHKTIYPIQKNTWKMKKKIIRMILGVNQIRQLKHKKLLNLQNHIKKKKNYLMKKPPY